MITNTAEKLAALKAKHAAEIAEMEQKEMILSLLPDGIPAPIISNIDTRHGMSKGVKAWLSFQHEYNADTIVDTYQILALMEAAGFEHEFVSLVKWDNYRPAAEPYHQNNVPQECPDSSFHQQPKQLKHAWPVCPLWIDVNQHTGSEVRCFYRKAGMLFSVSIDVAIGTYIDCRRVATESDWMFTGPVTVSYPPKWVALHDRSGRCVGKVSDLSKGHRDTDHGISGVIYFDPVVGQDDFPLSPAGMFASMTAPEVTRG